jgi:hypothetical protein
MKKCSLLAALFGALLFVAMLAQPLPAFEGTGIDEAFALSKQSGRPVLAVAGTKT